ncbi:hypothetical protein [Methanoregula sp.]|jgi:hypothetical protein|uniref:hypothetical protein n=1 Tax=Methanoregula sp. TaxID=2052170 RepID=UPI003C22604C
MQKTGQKNTIDEKSLYPLVEKWLKTYQHCFKTASDTGLQFSRIDVVGVRDTGGELSEEVETISVEVKKGTGQFATSCGQASGYKVYANRVYLADIRDDKFSTDEIAIANHLGIGLIQIKGNKCTEILTSPYYKPLTSAQLRLLEKLDLRECRLCGCFIDNSRKNFTKVDARTAADQEKGLIFWNYALGKRKLESGLYSSDRIATWERRYLCPECVGYLNKWVVSIIKKEQE